MDQTLIYLKEEKDNVSVEHRNLMRWGEGAGAFACLLQCFTSRGSFTKEEHI